MKGKSWNLLIDQTGALRTGLLSLFFLAILLVIASVVFHFYTQESTNKLKVVRQPEIMRAHIKPGHKPAPLPKPKKDDKPAPKNVKRKGESESPEERKDTPSPRKDRGPQNKPITLADQRYQRFLKEWINMGNNGKSNGKAIGVSVRNLRHTHTFFSMKPVLLLKEDGQVFDLSEQSRIFPAELAGYSGVAFECSEQWKDWGDTLEEMGIERESEFNIRYYMFPSIKNSIFSMAEQAVEYAKKRGFLAKEIRPSNVEVEGITQVVRREGGGRFGIFIPKVLLTTDGDEILIHREWFKNEKDFQLLTKCIH